MDLEIDLSRLDILNLEWPQSDRDLHIVSPVLTYLKKRFSVTYQTVSIFNGYYYILKHKPKMIIISNFQGAGINNEIVKTAFLSGIKIVTLISEGNVKEEELEQFLWGWNRDKNFYVDKMLVWSKRSENIFLSRYPDLESQLSTTGATGFDRYKLLTFMPKHDFLNVNQLKFKKIIGIAAWGFDHMFGDYFKKNEKHYLDVFGQEQIDIHRNDLVKLQIIYKKLIEQNKDILFILRYHPGTIDFEKNEFYCLGHFNNVFISNQYKNNSYQISDLINISDLWIGYETTTALEAWLLRKQTFLINPTRSDFIRENVHKGSPIVKTTEEAQKLIDEFYSNCTIRTFEVLKERRRKIIKDTIEYDDGKNYIRASEEIIKIFNKPDKKITFSFKIYKEAFKQILKLILSKTIFKKRWPNLNYKSDFAKKYQNMYDEAIIV